MAGAGGERTSCLERSKARSEPLLILACRRLAIPSGHPIADCVPIIQGEGVPGLSIFRIIKDMSMCDVIYGAKKWPPCAFPLEDFGASA